MFASLITKILDVVILVMMPPLLPGIINRVKAWFAGRKGPPLLQTYFDLRRLIGKQSVISSATTWVFPAGPFIVLGMVVTAGLLMPLGPAQAPIHFEGDLILLVYLLGAARFFTALAAMDTGSSFEGMGAAREIAFAVIAEPALFMVLLVLVTAGWQSSGVSAVHSAAGGLSGYLSLSTLLLPSAHAVVSGRMQAALILSAVALFIILLAECGRIPVDDPNTHLELTMRHEVMILDNSGRLLAAQTYASSMKLLILSALLVHLLLPRNTGLTDLSVSAWILCLLGMVLTVGIVGIVESFMARLRLKLIPMLLASAFLLGGFAFLLLIG